MRFWIFAHRVKQFHKFAIKRKKIYRNIEFTFQPRRSSPKISAENFFVDVPVVDRQKEWTFSHSKVCIIHHEVD